MAKKKNKEKQAVLRERSFKLELYELTDTFEKAKDNTKKQRKGKEQPTAPPLCELVSFSVEFSLNSIPLATVVPAVGTEITSNGRTLDVETIYRLVENNTPVGVYMEVLSRTTTDNDKEDKQYWPKKACLFKGYLQPPRIERTGYAASITLSIAHWLSALNEISLVTSASHISNPIETATQGYSNHLGDNKTTWANLNINSIELDKLWESGFQKIFTQLLNWGQQFANKHSDYVIKKRNQVSYIIQNLIESKNTDINRDIKDGVNTLPILIARWLQADSMQDFVNVTGWNKLVEYYSPNLLFSIAPTVDKAYLIPAPCIVIPDQATEVTFEEIYSIQAVPALEKKLGQVICVSALSHDNNNKPVGIPRYVKQGYYPQTPKDGLIVTVSYPTWVTDRTCSKIPKSGERLNFFSKPKADLKDEEDKDQRHMVGDAFAQYVYLVQAYNGTSIQVTTPFRMDVVPGAMVKLTNNNRSKDKEKDLYYGTVASVSIHITATDTPATSLLLTNIRDSVNIQDPVDNPKVTGYYKQQYTGKDDKLYGNDK